ncbi:MAG: hypothetical protein RIR69_903 [Actinomycetota bacterium]
MSDTFPRQYARTQRLTLGEPRSFTVSPDGARVVFARSDSGNDAVNALWVLDTRTGEERKVLDPRTIGANLAATTPEEMRRRERARESASGVVSYACDAAVEHAVTVLGGQIVVVNLLTNEIVMPSISPGVFDVRLSPDGKHLSYVRGRTLCIAHVNGDERVIASDESDTVSWGSAEFIAAEEMGRFRGYWWSPTSQHIAACRVDVSPVAMWHIADPAQPSLAATDHRYPCAGSHNALVSLHIIDVDTTQSIEVTFSEPWEYLNSVHWSAAGFIAQTQTRDQKRVDIYDIDPHTASAHLRLTDTDEFWVELVPGLPTLHPNGSLITAADRNGVRMLCVDNSPITPNSLQVRNVVSIDERIVFVANDLATPWIHDVYALHVDGQGLERLSPADGVTSASGHSSCLVLRHASLDSERAAISVVHGSARHVITSLTEKPLVTPRVRITTVGPRAIPVAILTPDDGGTHPLPVLLDPYGGPHAQRVIGSRAAYLSSQWFADQGFVVVIADNIGTPGKGSTWERGVHHDLAAPVLHDQVEVLDALAEIEPRADLSRVGIRGWSFGGYLAALAVLRRSDRFHAAIAGAPVTDWRLYDTHYTERYLGHPDIDDNPYTTTSLMNDVQSLRSPLLLIHGLADDNVVAAHTLQLSSALLAAGKPHEVLPLSGVTHMTPQEEVAENLLLHQLDFLRRHLG